MGVFMWVTTVEYARALNISPKTVQRRIKAGQVESKKDGGRRIVWLPEEMAADASPYDIYLPTETYQLQQEVAKLQAQLAEKDQQLKGMSDKYLEFVENSQALEKERLETQKQIEDRRLRHHEAHLTSLATQIADKNQRIEELGRGVWQKLLGIKKTKVRNDTQAIMQIVEDHEPLKDV
jgi:chromosome segregation ATPase